MSRISRHLALFFTFLFIDTLSFRFFRCKFFLRYSQFNIADKAEVNVDLLSHTIKTVDTIIDCNEPDVLLPKHFHTVFDTSALTQERAGLQVEMNVVAEQIEQCIAENARVAQNQEDYQKRYDGLAKRSDRTNARLEEVEQTIAEKQAHREMVEQFLSELAKQDAITEFTDELWYSMGG